MKVPRSYIGCMAMVTWEDPCGGGRHAIRTAPKGRAALSKWHEYGIIDDVSEGVVRLFHSECFNDRDSKEADEAQISWIPEDLILDIKVYQQREESPSKST